MYVAWPPIAVHPCDTFAKGPLRTVLRLRASEWCTHSRCNNNGIGLKIFVCNVVLCKAVIASLRIGAVKITIIIIMMMIMVNDNENDEKNKTDGHIMNGKG